MNNSTLNRMAKNLQTENHISVSLEGINGFTYRTTFYEWHNKFLSQHREMGIFGFRRLTNHTSRKDALIFNVF